MSEFQKQPDRWPLMRGDTLSNHDWFPFYGHRFLSSAFVIEATMAGRHDVVGAAMILWAEAMRQDPAGTLPDSDVQLAAMARYPSPDAWQAVRGEVLRDWFPVEVECDRTGEITLRLGHVIMEEVAVEMFKRKRSRDGAREAAKSAQRKSRIRKKMGEMKAPDHMVESDHVLMELVRFFEQAPELYITVDNVRAAMIECLGYTGEVRQFPGAVGGVN